MNYSPTYAALQSCSAPLQCPNPGTASTGPTTPLRLLDGSAHGTRRSLRQASLCPMRLTSRTTVCLKICFFCGSTLDDNRDEANLRSLHQSSHKRHTTVALGVGPPHLKHSSTTPTRLSLRPRRPKPPVTNRFGERRVGSHRSACAGKCSIATDSPVATVALVRQRQLVWSCTWITSYPGAKAVRLCWKISRHSVRTAISENQMSTWSSGQSPPHGPFHARFDT